LTVLSELFGTINERVWYCQTRKI